MCIYTLYVYVYIYPLGSPKWTQTSNHAFTAPSAVTLSRSIHPQGPYVKTITEIIKKINESYIAKFLREVQKAVAIKFKKIIEIRKKITEIITVRNSINS